LIRNIIRRKIAPAGIVNIDIERNAGDCKVIIRAARPGLVIGRGGKGIEELTKALLAGLAKIGRKPSLRVTVEELRRLEIAAANVAQNIAWDLEKRLPHRRLMKKWLETILQSKEAQGAKIRLSGRIGGAEIARNEWLAKGKLPLHTLRANIDYGEATAFTNWGTIGVKVWIYKGEVFEED